MAEARTCSAAPLQTFVQRLCRGMGAGEEVAAEVAHHLVRSNLSGHDSHGVLRLPQYVAQADTGELAPAATPRLLKESAVTALVDAQRGFGHYSTAYALSWAIAHAQQHGLAASAVRHSSHIGRVGEYSERAAERGLIALVTVGAAGPGVGGVVLYGGRRRFLGANPWSIGVPAQREQALIFDGSTSTIAEGKVRFALAKGAALPPGCITDRDGKPSTDPADFYAGGALVPLGGEVAGHKGYGLGLASALIGALAMIDDPEPTLIGASVLQEESQDSADLPEGIAAGVFLVVIDPAAFGDADLYRELVAANLAAAKRMPPAAGVDEVLIPGEPETRTRAARLRDGIALPEATWHDMERLADRFGVEMPESR